MNDIVTSKGRKIAGLGGADIADSMAFVGSVILDFDYDKMTHAIKVPDEKFRDKIFKTMEENVTSPYIKTFTTHIVHKNPSLIVEKPCS